MHEHASGRVCVARRLKGSRRRRRRSPSASPPSGSASSSRCTPSRSAWRASSRCCWSRRIGLPGPRIGRGTGGRRTRWRRSREAGLFQLLMIGQPAGSPPRPQQPRRTSTHPPRGVPGLRLRSPGPRGWVDRRRREDGAGNRDRGQRPVCGAAKLRQFLAVRNARLADAGDSHAHVPATPTLHRTLALSRGRHRALGFCLAPPVSGWPIIRCSSFGWRWVRQPLSAAWPSLPGA